MNPILAEHLKSAIQTFLGVLLLALSTAITSPDITVAMVFSSAFWFSLLSAAVRAAIKEVVARYVPVALGGGKGKLGAHRYH